MAMHWYLKKEYWDSSDDIEAVTIHYTWAPFGRAPDWAAHRESRFMPAGEELRTGVGQFSQYGPPAPVVPQQIDPRLRKKVLKMPNEIWDEDAGIWTAEYNLHYYYEIVERGDRQYSPVFSDEIRTRQVIFISPNELITGTCAYWSVADWDAPQFSPAEDPRFAAVYGEDHPLRQHNFYGTENKEAFGWARQALMDQIPLPHRFTAAVAAPVGMPVRLRFHVGNHALPEHQRWEDYWLDEMFIMAPGLEPFVVAPLGTEVVRPFVQRVAPEYLRDNPFAHLVPGFAG